jgi:hypothetical protein
VAQVARGAVLDSDGRGIPGAEVQLLYRSEIRTFVTDSTGVFRVLGLAPGTYAVMVRRIGYRSKEVQLEVLGRESTHLIYLDPVPFNLPALIVDGTRTGIYGIVGDSSFLPAPGARVQLLGPRGKTLQTDSTGRFAFPRAAGDYLMRVTLPGHQERRFSVSVERGKGREVTVALMRAGPMYRPAGTKEQWLLSDLNDRLRFGRRENVLTRDELERFGFLPLCDIPEIRRRLQDDTALLIDGNAMQFNACGWRAHDLELVELSCPSDVSFAGQRLPFSGSEREPARRGFATRDVRGNRLRGPGCLVLWQRR